MYFSTFIFQKSKPCFSFHPNNMHRGFFITDAVDTGFYSTVARINFQQLWRCRVHEGHAKLKHDQTKIEEKPILGMCRFKQFCHHLKLIKLCLGTVVIIPQPMALLGSMASMLMHPSTSDFTEQYIMCW